MVLLLLLEQNFNTVHSLIFMDDVLDLIFDVIKNIVMSFDT